MGDVADILGIQPAKAELTAGETAARILSNDKPTTNSNKLKKPKGMSREVFSLISKDGFVPAMQPANPLPAFKDKRAIAASGKWLWVPVRNAAMATQDCLYHWVSAEMQFSESPYTKFMVSMDPLVYTDEQYVKHLNDNSWTKEDTDQLIAVCNKYDLRWPVVYDRINLSKPRLLEDCQSRYYSVRNSLKKHGILQESPRMAPDLPAGYDMKAEKNRRLQQDLLFKK